MLVVAFAQEKLWISMKTVACSSFLPWNARNMWVLPTTYFVKYPVRNILIFLTTSKSCLQKYVNRFNSCLTFLVTKRSSP